MSAAVREDASPAADQGDEAVASLRREAELRAILEAKLVASQRDSAQNGHTVVSSAQSAAQAPANVPASRPRSPGASTRRGAPPAGRGAGRASWRPLLEAEEEEEALCHSLSPSVAGSEDGGAQGGGAQGGGAPPAILSAEVPRAPRAPAAPFRARRYRCRGAAAGSVRGVSD
jgi:hypothetical protein